MAKLWWFIKRRNAERGMTSSLERTRDDAAELQTINKLSSARPNSVIPAFM